MLAGNLTQTPQSSRFYGLRSVQGRSRVMQQRSFSSSRELPELPPKAPLTPEQEEVIKATAGVVAQHLDQITATFYPILFSRYPEVKPMFNEAHQRDGAQARALAAGVLAYVGLRHDPQQARGALATAISKHVSLGVQPEHYPLVGDCLMSAIGEVLGDAVTPEVAGAWGALYYELAHFLIDIEAQQYDAFAELPGGWRGTREFRIKEKRPESSVITSFILEPVDGGQVGFHQPGQYIGVRVVVDGKPIYRHYSLSDVSNGKTYRLSIKREPQGAISRHFHDNLEVGDTVDLLPPAGDLVLEGGEEPLLLASGGVGQTPLLPMARHALELERQVIYLHASQDAEQHAFREEIQELAKKYKDRLRVVTIHERGDTADHQGRVSKDLLAQLLPCKDTRCYFVGPQPFMSLVDKALEDLGIPREKRHYESFGPSRP